MSTILEQHFKPIELAKKWRLSDETVRRMFSDVPGVLTIDHPEELHRRGYRSIRIPASIAERIYAEYLSS